MNARNASRAIRKRFFMKECIKISSSLKVMGLKYMPSSPRLLLEEKLSPKVADEVSRQQICCYSVRK